MLLFTSTDVLTWKLDFDLLQVVKAVVVHFQVANARPLPSLPW